jgi:hypothetical protein
MQTEKSSDRSSGMLCEAQLRPGAICAAAIRRPPQSLGRMPLSAGGRMPRNGDPGHEGRGLVHRSPPSGSGHRIQLIIDSPRPPKPPNL